MWSLPSTSSSKLKDLDRDRVFAVREAHERVGEGEPHVARVLRVAERAPLRVLGPIEDLGEVAHLGQLGEGLPAEHLGRGRRDEGRVGRGGDARDLLEERHVLRVVAEFVVPDQRAERGAAERSVLFFVDLLEERGLVEFRGPLEVLQEILLGHVQDADLEHRRGLALEHEMLQAAPASLELLEVRVVHDLVELRRQELVDRRDARVDRVLEVLGEDDLPLKGLLDELGQHVLGVVDLVLAKGETAALEDLVEKTPVLLLDDGFGFGLLLGVLTHGVLPSSLPRPSRRRAAFRAASGRSGP